MLRRLLPAAALLLVLLPGCRLGDPAGAGSLESVASRGQREVSSNLLRTDYAGSESCAPCHAEIYAAWKRSPMHRMTRLPTPGSIEAPFDGSRFHFKNDVATLTQKGSSRFMRIDSAQDGTRVYRVTRVIGGRYREDFAGVEVSDLEETASPIGPPGQELILPVSYVFSTRSFRLKGYSVMVGERPGLRAGGVWNETCVLCHNTYPQFANLWGQLHGPGAPSYQAVPVDRILPPERRLAFQVIDERRLAADLRAEIRFLGGHPPATDEVRPLLALAASTMRARLVSDHLVEVGIGCEACHGGSREHVFRNRILPSFEPKSPFLRPAAQAGGAPAPTRAAWLNRSCARCHQVLFSRYPYTWEGGRRRSDPGGSHINSGEARDFLLGGCAQQMSCAQCHDPHAEDRPEHLARLGTAAGNGVCTTCHGEYAQPAALRAHAHHDPTGEGGACIGCHMPRKNMGLGYELTRYHRIGSPNDPLRVENDRPIECALCHRDARVGDLADTLERLWGRRYDRARLQSLYGNLNAEVLRATLLGGLPHERAVAIASFGEARAKEAVPLLAGQLLDPYPLLRHQARHALERILQSPIPVDIDRPIDEIRNQVERWQSSVPPPKPKVRSAAERRGHDPQENHAVQ